MKIIGTSGRGLFIVECTESTLNAITGREWNERRSFSIGETIHVCETWDKLNSILLLDKRFREVCRTLAAMQTLLTNVGDGIVEQIKVEPVVAEVVQDATDTK